MQLEYKAWMGCNVLIFKYVCVYFVVKRNGDKVVWKTKK